MKQGFLKKYTSIMVAISVTLAVASGAYAFIIKPNLNNVIKDQISTCQVEERKKSIEDHDKIDKSIEKINEHLGQIERRAMKAEISGWVKLTKKERDEANELYKVLGGK
jgi:hypothetical protein